MRSASATSLIIVFLTGCVQRSNPHTNPRPDTSATSSVVRGVELARVAQSANLMAALQKIRPVFLTARGGTLLVSVDGLVYDDPSVLRTIAVTQVCEVRLLRGMSVPSVPAVILAGGRVSSGADLIEVSLRHDATTPCPRQ